MTSSPFWKRLNDEILLSRFGGELPHKDGSTGHGKQCKEFPTGKFCPSCLQSAILEQLRTAYVGLLALENICPLASDAVVEQKTFVAVVFSDIREWHWKPGGAIEPQGGA